MKYSDCTTEELAGFCASRGLVVAPPPPNATTRQLRRTYFTALKKGDAAPGPFRFLDLSPELRTNVYENLLVFNNSFTCHPQILAASKQVNNEAKNILYGDNLIEVKLWDDGVYVHGQFCGAYTKGVPIKVEWPAFLRRVQFLRFSHGAKGMGIPHLKKSARSGPKVDCHASHTSENVLYSLCAYLTAGHQLRSVKIDLRRADLANIDDAFKTHSLYLLGPLKECAVEGYGGVQILKPWRAASSLRVFTKAIASWRVLREDVAGRLQAIRGTLPMTYTQEANSVFLRTIEALLVKFDIWDPLSPNFMQVATLDDLLEDFSKAAKELRELNEVHFYFRKHCGPTPSFKNILFYEIHARMATRPEGLKVEDILTASAQSMQK